jgi:rhamnosyltransferase subunit B
MLKASTFRVADRMVDKWMAPQFGALRRELGLPPVKRIFKGWAHSPDALLCLWPEWFGPRQPDWPEHATLAGFVLNDEVEQRPLGPALEAWLDHGAPPILFAAGSANLTPKAFFAQAVDAARQLGRRALLVSPAPEVAALAGGDVFHSSYAPFSRVLPRADVFVGHGGIGSCAQGLAAGVPQLATPRAYDQFDNASRLVDLGVGTSLPASRWSASRAAEAIGQLLVSPTVGDACRKARDEIAAENSLKRACEVIEWARVAPA